jgi:nucleoside-diphosphate-sugar epimerase
MRTLITGGAGFIGSHLVDACGAAGHDVVVLDDLSTGFVENVPGTVEFVKADLADFEVVRGAMIGAELVLHHAASRAVLRSVHDPIATDRANTLGTLNVLTAARDAGARRVVVASSSSVYGGAAPLPTAESAPPMPRSPYAVSKLAGEQYARVFAELYGLETVALRYFNVFGPRQRPDSPYAGVIPLFIDALSAGRRVEVHGDGRQFRDFTFIEDVVRANLQAADADADVVSGGVYNIARGDRISLLDLLSGLSSILGVEPDVAFGPPRAGDVRQSCADVSAARRDFGYTSEVTFAEGLDRTVDWFLRERRE